MNYKISWVVQTGAYHTAQGIPCQDQVYVCREGDTVCAALADGAGSRERSHIGAACVTRVVAQLACAEFARWWDWGEEELAGYLLCRCLEELERQSPPIYELASTLLFFAADGEGRYLSGHLGDGVQIRVMPERTEVFSPPENGAFENETYFLTEEDALEHFRLRRGRLEEVGGLLLMSDGMADSLYQRSTGTPAKACSTMVRWLQEGDEAVITQALEENTRRFFVERSGDDLSLVVLAWHNEEESPK